MAIAPNLVSLEAFLQQAEEKPALEFEDGVVIQKVSPKTKHSAVQGESVTVINAAGTPKKVAKAFPELRATYGGRSTVPDVSVYVWERIPLDSDGEVANDIFVPPDIAIEIASPEQSAAWLTRRCVWYVANDVRIALMIDPADKTVLAFRKGHDVAVWRGSDRIDLSEVLPDFDLTVDQLFSALRLD